MSVVTTFDRIISFDTGGTFRPLNSFRSLRSTSPIRISLLSVCRMFSVKNEIRSSFLAPGDRE